MHTQPMGAGSSFHSTSPNSATPHLPPRPLLLFAGFDFFSWCQLQGPKSGWGWLLGGQLGLDSRVWCYGQDGCREGLQRLGAASGLGVWQERCRGGHLWPGGQGSRILNAESRGVNQGGLARCQGQRLGCRGQWWGWGQGLRGIGHYWNRNDSQWGGGWQVLVGVLVGVLVATEAGVVPRCGVPPQAGHGPAWPGCWPSSAPVPAPSEDAPAPLRRGNTRIVSAGPTVLGSSFTCPSPAEHNPSSDLVPVRAQ